MENSAYLLEQNQPHQMKNGDRFNNKLLISTTAKNESLAPHHKLPSLTASILRLHTLCPYYTMFPLNFPFTALSRSVAGEWVLDPFCGRGTTLFASRLRGLSAVGIDSNPVAAAVAAAKLASSSAEKIVYLCERILSRKSTPHDMPNTEFWQFCYSKETLVKICILRDYFINQCETQDEIILRALILGILHGPLMKGSPTYLSNQMPRTYATKPASALRYWKQHGLIPPIVDVLDTVRRRAQFVLSDTPNNPGGSVYMADSRSAEIALPNGEKFAWVITSPPYFGMRTYRPDQWLRNWFVGGIPDVDYSQEGQISHHAENFTQELSKVWKNISKFCRPGANLIIRFGALPSKGVSTKAVIKESLADSDSGWRILTIRDAGKASNGKRQANQFKRKASEPVSEIDVYARLEA